MIFKRKVEADNKRKVVALIDFENIARQAVVEGKIVDLKKLRDWLLEKGEILFSFIFVPDNYAYSASLSGADDLGFQVVLCQKAKSGSEKIEDTVDIHIIQTGLKFLTFPEVTDFVIVSDDGHMVNLAKEVINRRRRLWVLGTDNLSRAMRQVVDMHNFDLLPLSKKS